MATITNEKIKQTVIGICNTYASEALSMSDDMAMDEQIQCLQAGFRDSNSKLHGILMLFDDADNTSLNEFIELYIGRLKKVYDGMIERRQRLEAVANVGAANG